MYKYENLDMHHLKYGEKIKEVYEGARIYLGKRHEKHGTTVTNDYSNLLNNTISQ